MASTNVNNTLPQGFSVFQPTLGAPLQFFPALGTKLLDDMMNAYIPGSASLQEKRGSISLDFLEHTQKTGQAFKFYTVPGFVANPDSPPFMASPAQPSLSSSLTVSPIASDWDWTSVSGTTSSSKSSHNRSARKSSNTSRHQTAGDFSHMPGMKIMTKEGLDVTNSASRGSKTKEQRDHAHLMRIIKACDSCRRKKIRCDPSHKKRTSSQAVSQPAAKTSKKARVVVPQEQSTAGPARLSSNMMPPPAPSLAFDSFSTFDDLSQSTAATAESWEDFIHYPQEEMDTDYDFFFDPQGFLSPMVSDVSSSASGSKSISPTSQPEYAANGFDEHQLPVDFAIPTEQQNVLLPYMDASAGSNTYTDFNLYSPQSSFSEDERMLSVASTTPATSSAEGSQVPSPPDRPPSDYALFGEVGEADLLRVEHGSLPVSSQQETGLTRNSAHESGVAMNSAQETGMTRTSARESYAVMPDDQWHYSELQPEASFATEGGVQLGGLAAHSNVPQTGVINTHHLLETVSLHDGDDVKKLRLTFWKGISDHHEHSQPMVTDQSVRSSEPPNWGTRLTFWKKATTVDRLHSSTNRDTSVIERVRRSESLKPWTTLTWEKATSHGRLLASRNLHASENQSVRSSEDPRHGTKLTWKKATPLDRWLSTLHQDTLANQSVRIQSPWYLKQRLTPSKVSPSTSTTNVQALNRAVVVRQALSAIVEEWRLTCMKESLSYAETGTVQTTNAQSVRLLASSAIHSTTDFLPDTDNQRRTPKDHWCCNDQQPTHCWLGSTRGDGTHYREDILA